MRRREGEKDSEESVKSYQNLPCRRPQQLGGSWNQDLHQGLPREHRNIALTFPLPGREPDWRWYNQGINWCPNGMLVWQTASLPAMSQQWPPELSLASLGKNER